jgi:hypothetical protein
MYIAIAMTNTICCAKVMRSHPHKSDSIHAQHNNLMNVVGNIAIWHLDKNQICI